jgi:hypothetical protein
MDSARKPSVLFVYFTYTQQTLKVVEAMAGVLRGRGCDVPGRDRIHRPSLRSQVQRIPHAAPVPGGPGDDPGGTAAPPGADPVPRRRHRTGIRPGVHRLPPHGGCRRTFRSARSWSPMPRAPSLRWAGSHSPSPSPAAGTGVTT